MSHDGSPPDGREPVEWARWLLRTENPTVRFVRDMASSALAVVLIGALLFGVSGVWPPMVAVQSGSMEPHMYRGDLVFIVDEQRFASDAAVEETGVVPHRAAVETEYQKFGEFGDVIVYRPNGHQSTPIIHRAQFWVAEGENWYGKADPDSVNGNSCDAVPNCPAPHAGFITQGDNNPFYDQVSGISDPVKPSWIRGTAEIRVPWLGFVRLYFTEIGVEITDVGVETIDVEIQPPAAAPSASAA